MASIRKRCRHPRDQWDTCSCRWFIRRKTGGRDTYTPVAGTTRAQAERALRNLESIPAETMRQAVQKWLDRKERDPAARVNSLASYRSRTRHIVEWFGDMRVTSLRPDLVVEFIDNQLTLRRPATVQGIYAALTSVLRDAQRREVIRHLPLPPTAGIPTAVPREHPLTLVEVEVILERMPGVWGKVAELVFLTGLRWGEVVAIEPGDIDGHVVRVRRTLTRTGTVNAPKTRAGSRVVPLSPRAHELLGSLELPVHGDYRRAREALVHAMGELHRPGMGWHSLRNAHATLLDSDPNLTIRDIAARMGHGANFSQTLAYGLVRESGRAGDIDSVRLRHVARPSGSAGAAAPLAAYRGLSRRAAGRPGDP